MNNCCFETYVALVVVTVAAVGVVIIVVAADVAVALVVAVHVVASTVEAIETYRHTPTISTKSFVKKFRLSAPISYPQDMRLSGCMKEGILGYS